jgi:tetratricopeptide (TPR) repeat protein
MDEIKTRNAIAGRQGTELAELAALLKHAERGAWAFAVYNTVAVREATTATLRQLVAPLPVHDWTLSPSAPNPLAYLDSLSPAGQTGRAVVFFFEAERAGQALWGFLESQREALARYPHGLVFWVTPAGRRDALRRAPNFWSQRSGVFDFTVESPQVLTQMQERWAGLPVRIESAADVQRQIRLYKGLLNEYRDRTDVPAANRLDLHHKLGYLYRFAGRWEEAAAEWQAELAQAQQLGDKRAEAQSLHNMGIVAQDRGDYDTALDLYRRSLEIMKALDDRAGVSTSLHNMGMVTQARGDYDAALDLYRRSLEIDEALGDRAGVSKSLHQMGMVAQLRGDYDVALDFYQRSLEIMEALGDRAGVSKSLHQMGRVAQLRGDYDAALDFYHRSLESKETLGDRAGAAVSRAQMSLLHEQLGQLDQALALIRQAEAEFARLGAAELAQARQVRARIEAKLQGNGC